MRQKIIIGIDPGSKTGFAVKNLTTKEYIEVSTIKAYQVPEKVLQYGEHYELYVVFEDARQRDWFGNYERMLYGKYQSGQRMTSEERATFKGLLMGAGDVKGACRNIEQFLEDHDIPYLAQKPKKGGTKQDKKFFERLTGWNKRSSEHSRDAGMLIHGYNAVNLKLYFKLVA